MQTGSDVAVNDQRRSDLAVDVFRQLTSVRQCVEVEEPPFPYGAVLGYGLPYGSVLRNGLRCDGRIILRPVENPHVDSDAAPAGLPPPVAGASQGPGGERIRPLRVWSVNPRPAKILGI